MMRGLHGEGTTWWGASSELRCKNNAFYIFVYVLANSLLATRGSGQKNLPPPMRRIPGVGGWVAKKLVAIQAEVLNQSLVDRSLDDEENQRPRTPYITTFSHLLGLLQSMLSWPPIFSWQPMFSWQPSPSWKPMLYSAEPNTSQPPTTSRQGRAILHGEETIWCRDYIVRRWNGGGTIRWRDKMVRDYIVKELHGEGTK